MVIETSKAGGLNRRCRGSFFPQETATAVFTRVAYKVLFNAAVATTSEEIRKAIGVKPIKGAVTAGRILTKILRYALGFSPAWAAALDRSGTKRPSGIRFRDTAGVTR